ncbi:MAG TPA: hypothetical protein VLM40_13255 [Gemmata sp.]|nr:hypothetical protein [Gemmata sp.]
MWRRDWLGLVAVILGGAAIGVVAWLLAPSAVEKPLPVPDGDQEIAWLHNPTSYETWENFVWATKRAEMTGDGGPEGLRVDDSGAFPEKTTVIPEIVIRRVGFEGALRVRWYKTTDQMPQEAWVNALSARDPPPLAVLGGWTSDRAKPLGDAMREARWKGPRPLLFLSTATADKVIPDVDIASGGQVPDLIAVYDRSFRFCFTNKQMAEAVADFVLSDARLRPGTSRPSLPPLIRMPGLFASGGWEGLAGLASDTIPAFAIEWQDDPYSTDLSERFRQALRDRADPLLGNPLLNADKYPVPFTTGRMNRATAVEAEVARDILRRLPPPGTRTVLVIPTVSAPARRTLRELVQGNADVGRQLVALTGDGISVNTFFRDRDLAWPVRSLRIPFVAFAHADPFAWDSPKGGATPPRGYELPPPAPGEVCSTTEDLRHYNRLVRVLSAAVFPDGGGSIVNAPDAVATAFRQLDPPFFQQSGNRRGGSGEHVVVIRPTIHAGGPIDRDRPDASLEVYVRSARRSGWVQLHSLPLGMSTGRNQP